MILVSCNSLQNEIQYFRNFQTPSNKSSNLLLFLLSMLEKRQILGFVTTNCKNQQSYNHQTSMACNDGGKCFFAYLEFLLSLGK